MSPGHRSSLVGESAWHLSSVGFRHARASQDTLLDVSLEIPRGLLTTIIGPNGAGKSTLMQLLLGVLRADRGHIVFNGRDIATWSRRDLALAVAVVPQGEAEPLYSVRDTVAMGRYPHRGPWEREREQDIEAIERAMQQCDVTRFADRYVNTLSGGERQRVRVARALAQESPIVVLDEPTTYLDIRHEMALFEQVARMREQGLTAVLVTHNLNLAARYADRMVLLADGGIAAQGTADEVLTAASISAVYEWPVEIETHRSGAPQVVPQRVGQNA
ncbi:MAG: ABC transporter ATP-binding protein [Gemmatimonadaceae bacterium]|nr:ABC transporter ATP-binding protein [Gemmatimonadaceae bacterium]